MAEHYECDNCAFQGEDHRFKPARDISERIMPGMIYTNLECPHCGGLAYPLDKLEDKDSHD